MKIHSLSEKYTIDQWYISKLKCTSLYTFSKIILLVYILGPIVKFILEFLVVIMPNSNGWDIMIWILFWLEIVALIKIKFAASSKLFLFNFVCPDRYLSSINHWILWLNLLQQVSHPRSFIRSTVGNVFFTYSQIIKCSKGIFHIVTIPNPSS